MKENDEKILELKNQIKTKKEELTKIDKFRPITNCIITSYVMGFDKLNINTLNTNDLKLLAIRLKSYLNPNNGLKYTDVLLSGFKLSDWVEDIENKIENNNKISKMKELEVLENRLTEMLSNTKRTELEIEEISKLL
jgi:hypothetical protein